MRALFFFLFLLPIISSAQNADEVIRQYLRFIGGEKDLKKVKTMVTTGEYDYGGIVFPFTTYAKAPDRYKFVVPFNGKYYAQGYNGKNGWKIDAFKNETTPTLLEGAAALAMANEADVELESPFIDYKIKGHQLKLEGTDTVENKLCYKISLLKKNGQTEIYYFDAVTYTLHLKIATAKNVELEGALLHTYFYNYTAFGGFQTSAFTISTKQVSKVGDQTILTVTVKEVLVNSSIPDEEFNVMKN